MGEAAEIEAESGISLENYEKQKLCHKAERQDTGQTVVFAWFRSGSHTLTAPFQGVGGSACCSVVQQAVRRGDLPQDRTVYTPLIGVEAERNQDQGQFSILGFG